MKPAGQQSVHMSQVANRLNATHQHNLKTEICPFTAWRASTHVMHYCLKLEMSQADPAADDVKAGPCALLHELVHHMLALTVGEVIVITHACDAAKCMSGTYPLAQ